jgi:hypothetical protein
MATLTTVNSSQYADAYVDVPSDKLKAADKHGVLRRAYGSYTVDAADEFGTSGLINMFKLPKGATLVYARVAMEAAGATGIFDVGWDGGTNSLETADPDGILASVDPGAAAVDALMPSTRPGYNKRFDDEVTIQVDWTEASADSGGDTLELECWYIVD